MKKKVDIDSARYLGTLAMTYSKKIGFAQGERIAGATLAQVAYEGRNVVDLVRFSNYIKQPDRVWYMRNMVFLVASGDAKNSPDSLLRWSQLTKQAALEAKDATVANEAEYYIGWAYYRMGKQRECKRAFLTMINYHSRRNDPEAELEAWYQLSTLVDDADTSYPSTIEAAEKVLALSKITGHMSYMAHAYLKAGYGYYVRGNIEKSQAVLLEAEEVLFRVDVKNRRFVYELLTKIYAVKGDGARALHYAEATLDHVRRYDNTPENIRLYSIRLSEVFLHFGKTNEYEATLRSVRVASPPEKATDWFYIIMLAQIMRRTDPQEAIDYLLDRKKCTH
ncbi:hypothetical protein MKQ70_04440 [Chitinophaga sedimenti]|uniref:tetratricopeptide repeat protein n=1 Tax=Chitinophaga sedimenti TaxID=2033606 RepID=UPI002004C910|nr:hypothetical protein [Chitinophaga sedimenti]MCK7554299.1 hypothetical protein [Chitinophaga sedimenti]